MAVLAGGRSSRFGSDKARFVYRGQPLLAHVLASLAEAAERFIVARTDYPEFGVPTVRDRYPLASPLSGVCTALQVARCEWVAVAACDLPYLTAAYWRALLARCGAAEAVMVVRAGRLEPLAALYRRSALAEAERQLAQQAALQQLAACLRTELVPWEALGLPEATLRNINTPEALL